MGWETEYIGVLGNPPPPKKKGIVFHIYLTWEAAFHNPQLFQNVFLNTCLQQELPPPDVQRFTTAPAPEFSSSQVLQFPSSPGTRILQPPLLTELPLPGERGTLWGCVKQTAQGRHLTGFGLQDSFLFFVFVPCFCLRERGVFAITAVWLLCCFYLFVLSRHVWSGEGGLLSILPVSQTVWSSMGVPSWGRAFSTILFSFVPGESMRIQHLYIKWILL